MNPPYTVLRDHLGKTHHLRPGDMIGRAVTATCRLDDPRVSEAHAMVSLRGGGLRLLSLRRPVLVDDIEEDELPLEVGQLLTLAEGVVLEVLEVALASEVLALQVNSERPWPLRRPSYSLIAEPQPELVPRYLPQALGHVWSTSEGWSIQLGAEKPQMVRPGRSWTAGGLEVTAVTVPLDQLDLSTTEGRPEPLRLVVRYTTVHIYRPRRTAALIDGLRAQLLSELVLMGCPAPWKSIAESLWPEEADRIRLQNRFHRIRQRLTATLREVGIRENLVRTDGAGNFEVFLMPGDEVVDET